MGLLFSENKIKLSFWHGILIMGAILALTQISSCRRERIYNNEVDKIRSYRDSVMSYTARDGRMVNYNLNLKTTLDAFLMSTQDSMRRLLYNLNIPKPEVITIYRDVFYVDSIPQVSLNLDGCKFDTTFSIKNKYYEVEGSVSNKALSLRSIMIPNTTTVVIGELKTKWWKKNDYIATVTHSNPNIKTEGISSFTLEEKRSKWSFGPYIGYGFYYDPWKGNVGHGISGGVAVNYRLIGWNKK